MDSVKIGPLVYQIERVPELWSEGRRYDGVLIQSEQKIKIWEALQPGGFRQTLWHEITHELLIQIGIPDFPDNQVDALAFRLMDLLQDNPWLAEALP